MHVDSSQPPRRDVVEAYTGGVSWVRVWLSQEAGSSEQREALGAILPDSVARKPKPTSKLRL
jgi:hypothetical protein